MLQDRPLDQTAPVQKDAGRPMRKLTYYVATTVDGFISHPDGSLQGFLMDGPHAEEFRTKQSEFDTVLMGRETYELGRRFGVLSPYPSLKQFVFSTRYVEAPHPDIQLVRGNAAEVVTKLKASPGSGIWLCGGSTLAGHLMAAGLIDEVLLKVNPVVFGTGKPLLSSWHGATALTLTDTRRFDNGVLLLSYRLDRRGNATD